MKTGGRIALFVIGVILLGSVRAEAQFAGFDRNGDFACDPDEMGFELTAADQGQTFSFDIFFDGISGGIINLGCTFCVQDKNLVNDESFVYSLPSIWTASPMLNSDEVFLDISDWIPENYPDFRCYLVQGADFTLSTPVYVPLRIGTFSFTYAAAEDGCVGFLIDGAVTGYQTTDFATGMMDGEGQTCPPYECDGTTGTESGSWGQVKRLFR